MKLPFLLTVGEWLADNAVAVIGLLIGWLVSIGGVIWKISRLVSISEATGTKVEALAKAFQSHVDDVDEHVKDLSVHTTFEQRQAIGARFDKIEHNMADGHNRIENKIDKLTDWMMKR